MISTTRPAAHRNTVQQMVLPDTHRLRSDIDQVWDEIGKALAIPARLMNVEIHSTPNTAREIMLYDAMRQNDKHEHSAR